MVGDAALRVIVGADALGAVAAAYHQFAFGSDFRLLFAHLRSLDARRQHAHGLCLVAVLRAVILAFDHDAGGQVRDAHGRIGFVDVLAAGAAGTISINADFRGVDHHITDFIGFRQHRHGAGAECGCGPGFRYPARAARDVRLIQT